MSFIAMSQKSTKRIEFATRPPTMNSIFTCLLLAFSTVALAESNLTLTGRYESGTDAEAFEMLVGEVCFYPNPTSAKLLPRPKSDKRLAWFCFTNTAKAQKLLGISLGKNHCRVSGTATVKVKNYQVYLEESDGFDTATLLAVKNNANIKINACKTPAKTMKPSSLPNMQENESYTSIRQKMLQAGWQPFHAPDADVCYKEDERCAGRPEMESCVGTNLGNCRFLWVKDGEKTGICTIGDNAIFDGVCD